jgi:hypothetical protein
LLGTRDSFYIDAGALNFQTFEATNA